METRTENPVATVIAIISKKRIKVKQSVKMTQLGHFY